MLVAGGDGDGFSIGGGHVPHAIRRNIDITYIVMDNQIYGLTKGQLSPTSPRGLKTVTSEYGSLEEPVNPLLYVLAYGADFVAQGTPADMAGLADGHRGGHPLPGLLLRQRAVAVRDLRRGGSAGEGHRAIMKPLAKLGHDPDRPPRGDGARAAVRQGAAHRRLLPEPGPAADDDALVQERQRDPLREGRSRANASSTASSRPEVPW